jgi:hypothetical protein
MRLSPSDALDETPKYVSDPQFAFGNHERGQKVSELDLERFQLWDRKPPALIASVYGEGFDADVVHEICRAEILLRLQF